MCSSVMLCDVFHMSEYVRSNGLELRTLEVFIGGLVDIVLAIGPKVRGRWIFKDDKNP
jgi:hypothetical protein